MNLMFIYIRTCYRFALLLLCILVVAIFIPILFNRAARWLPRRRATLSLLLRCIYGTLNIHVHTVGKPTSAPSLWVCNHISWLDVILLAGQNPVDFIAKREVRQWPLIGRMAEQAGTLFVDRDNKFQAYRALPLVGQRILSGTSVVVFPEGTTSDGQGTLPFKPMFYQAAIRAGLKVQPIALSYCDREGEPSATMPFIDDDHFMTSLMRIIKEPKTFVSIHYLPPLNNLEIVTTGTPPKDHMARAMMANTCEQLIERAIKTRYEYEIEKHKAQPLQSV